MRGLGQYIDAVHGRLAPFKRWILQAIGVDPQFQGRGYAGRLYEHFGFTVAEESAIPETNLTNWAMLRKAR